MYEQHDKLIGLIEYIKDEYIKGRHLKIVLSVCEYDKGKYHIISSIEEYKKQKQIKDEKQKPKFDLFGFPKE
jgi:hypothetical protein